MKKLFFIIIMLSVAVPAFAGVTVSVKSDLTRVRLHEIKRGPNDLVMENGVAWWIRGPKNTSGFFTYAALKEVWRTEGLELQSPRYSNGCFPDGLEGGLFMATWSKETKRGFVIPVTFNLFSIGLGDEKGGMWHNGDLWISENPEDWQEGGRPSFWEP